MEHTRWAGPTQIGTSRPEIESQRQASSLRK